MPTVTRAQVLAKRRTRSQAVLLEASYHVHYERKVLQHHCDVLVNRPPSGGHEYAALMDSFLLHARNLNHFLYGVDRAVQLGNPRIVQANDVIAEDYLPWSAGWQKRRGGQLSEQEIRDINVQLAHLSYTRARRVRDDYPYEGIRDRLIQTLEQFIGDAPPANLCKELLNDYPIYPYLGVR